MTQIYLRDNLLLGVKRQDMIQFLGSHEIRWLYLIHGSNLFPAAKRSCTLNEPTTAILKRARETTFAQLYREIAAIGPPGSVFFTRLNCSLRSALGSLLLQALPFLPSMGIVAVVTLLGYYYLRQDVIILERRTSADGTEHEYFIPRSYTLPLLGNAWYAESSLSAAEREQALAFNDIIQTPKEILAKRAVDQHGNPSAIDSAVGMQYLVRAEGWQIGRLADQWVGQQQLETITCLWPMVCQFEKDAGDARSIVQAVPLKQQQQAGGRPRDALGRFTQTI